MFIATSRVRARAYPPSRSSRRYPRPRAQAHIAVRGDERYTSQPLSGEGWLFLTRSNGTPMQRSTTDRMNDYDAVVMGALEPILVLSVMAVIAFLVRLFW